MRGDDLFKTGLIVADIRKAMEDLSRTLGLDWTPVREADLTLDVGGRSEEVRLSFAYSTNGPPFMELIEAHATGYYAVAGGSDLHHIGIWVDDLAAESERLAGLGMPLEAGGVRDGVSPAMFAFHTNPHGLRVELVDAAMKPTFEEWLGGGELDL